ncbi:MULTISPECIES: MCE family protein [Mycolicibacterium]|uniref:Virulence factor Mce family protein n=1 Tax=Mycolicibacterium senegalense TaxID=1796 RepID=A0A378W6J1_9MYCO|nr:MULTISPECIES: MCE family protein [Mycolicibacterium]MCV7335522.1 MCE family protein [Mycolicibacterium senegalense]MDR7288585.1 virulence factor Mce-like protein [Mycolicibacterium senegalense]QZA25510.1 MCE family protein [Mycolicibacterium senegalense]CDP85334.1 virulence factor Mce family protein [Mycolicibacterium farcinogenes]SUA27841.1 virulence factor Mce family protein [Mycolicibacterium senegalense]
MTRPVRKYVLPAVLTACLTLSGCASEGLASLPLPAPGVGSGGYQLTAIFSNALNLPANAKVKLAGADVGELESMVASNYTAVTTLRIMDGVRLPRGTTAELRSATPLGDVFVSVRPPSPLDPNAPLLKDGDTIGLDDTQAAATVESLLGSAAILVNGGAVRNFTNIINGLGKATGDQGQAFGNLIAKTNHTLGTLNARSDQLSTAMTETSRVLQQIEDKNQTVSELMDAAGPATDTLAEHTTQIADLISQIGDTSAQLRKFPSIAGTDSSGRSVIADANKVAGAWNDVAQAPDASLYSLNRLMPPLVKATSGNGLSVRASIDRLILGSIPDIGFAGDPGLHGPKRYNWHQLVGSLQYTLLRLQERVVGRGPSVPQVPVIPSPTEPGEIIPAPQAPPQAPPAQAPPAEAPAAAEVPR